MTLEEALEASGAEPVNDIFQINPENRTITVPESEKIFGVANDGNAERKHFKCPKIVGDNIDLSTMHLYINYQNANGQKAPYWKVWKLQMRWWNEIRISSNRSWQDLIA